MTRPMDGERALFEAQRVYLPKGVRNLSASSLGIRLTTIANPYQT